MIAGVGKVIKRRVVKISVAILVVVGIALGLLLLLVRDRRPEMSFGFLDGRTLTARIGVDGGRSRVINREIYAFQADFNDVVAEADIELSRIGFSLDDIMGVDPQNIRYVLFKTSGERITVCIRRGQRLSTRTTRKPSKPFRSNRHVYREEDGWVSADICYDRPRPWPRFLNRLRRALR